MALSSSGTSHPNRAKFVVGPSGAPLTMCDLPLPATVRWVPRHKAEVVAAVCGGLLTLQEACNRYNLSAEELISWQFAMNRHGVLGLRVTRVQQYSKDHNSEVARAYTELTSEVVVGELKVNPKDKRNVEVLGRKVHLTRKEYQLLTILVAHKLEHPHAPLSKDMSLERLYGGRNEPEFRTIDVLVSKLRKKLADVTHSQEYPDGKNFIETVWGRGYLLVGEVNTADSKLQSIDHHADNLGVLTTRLEPFIDELANESSMITRLIKDEETRTGLTDPKHFSYSILAKAALHRVEKLGDSIKQLSEMRIVDRRVLPEMAQV